MEWDPAERDASDRYRFLVSAVAPRPIAWITTLDPATGVVNAAPFSWYNSVCADPMLLAVAIIERSPGVPKDTVRNIRATGEFVVNVAVKPLLREMVASSGDYPADVSEVEALHLRTAPSVRVRPPRLADSPVHMECRLHREIPLGDREKVSLILGEVVHVAADDGVLDGKGNLDPDKVTLAARMGGSEYTDTQAHYTVKRPGPIPPRA